MVPKEEDGGPSRRNNRRVVDIHVTKDNLLLRILPENSVEVVLQHGITETYQPTITDN